MSKMRCMYAKKALTAAPVFRIFSSAVSNKTFKLGLVVRGPPVLTALARDHERKKFVFLVFYDANCHALP